MCWVQLLPPVGEIYRLLVRDGEGVVNEIYSRMLALQAHTLRVEDSQ